MTERVLIIVFVLLLEGVMEESSFVIVYVGEPSFIMDLYVKEFRKIRVKVILSESLQGVLGILKINHVDAILVNINNTKLDGFGLIKAIKPQVDQGIPVIATGILSSGESKKEACAFIEEPLAKDVCLEEIKRVLKKKTRKSVRVKAQDESSLGTVFCSFRDMKVECELLDLGLGGVKVLCPQKIPEGQKLSFLIKLELNREIFTLNTEAVIEICDSRQKRKGFYSYRISFVKLSAKERDLLKGFIKGYQESDPAFIYWA